MDVHALLFWALALITGACSVAVVVTQNIVRAATWLLFALAGVSGVFFLLGTDFVAATQLLVYVGGTLVLVVFGVMLTAQGPFINLKANGFEWYFLDGHVSLDFAYGNDSSSLGDESLLAITQNASMSKPVLGIGGGNGLTPTVNSYNVYFGSIATAAGNKKAFILPGYAHVDPLIAHTNEAVPLIVSFLQQIEAGANPVFP